MAGSFPTREKIVKAQTWLIRKLPNVKFDPLHSCWACGYYSEDFDPERAHVTARANGGTGAPENFLLLCYGCHRSQPDGVSRSAQERWLLAVEPFSVRVRRSYVEDEKMLREEARRLGAEDGIEYPEIMLALWGRALGAVGIHRIAVRAMKRVASGHRGGISSNISAALTDHFRESVLSGHCRMPKPLDAEEEAKARKAGEECERIFTAQGAKWEALPWEPANGLR